MSQQVPVLRVAAKGLVVDDRGCVLIVREASTYSEGSGVGRYQLPGGRLEAGERFEDGLCREMREEVGLDVHPLYPVFVGEWRPIIKGEHYQIIAVFVACTAKNTVVRLSHEHDDYAWIKPEDRSTYDLMDPDWEVIDAYAQRAKTTGSTIDS